MSFNDKNQLVQILHANKCPRKYINPILIDLERDGTFDDAFIDDEFWDIEQQATVIFSNKQPTQKIKALARIKRKQKKTFTTITNRILDREARVREKQKELIRRGIVPEGQPDESYLEEEPIYRHGRTPHHEAIAMRDLELVKKYCKEGKYLTHKDNNGNTPWEMAYYENYSAALLLFELYGKWERSCTTRKPKKKKAKKKTTKKKLKKKKTTKKKSR